MPVDLPPDIGGKIFALDLDLDLYAVLGDGEEVDLESHAAEVDRSS